jgi:hypothetical protein
VTLLFAVAPSRKAGHAECAPDERRLLTLNMRTGAVVKDSPTPDSRRRAIDRRFDDDEDEFDGPDAA